MPIEWGCRPIVLPFCNLLYAMEGVATKKGQPVQGAYPKPKLGIKKQMKHKNHLVLQATLILAMQAPHSVVKPGEAMQLRKTVLQFTLHMIRLYNCPHAHTPIGSFVHYTKSVAMAT